MVLSESGEKYAQIKLALVTISFHCIETSDITSSFVFCRRTKVICFGMTWEWVNDDRIFIFSGKSLQSDVLQSCPCFTLNMSICLWASVLFSIFVSPLSFILLSLFSQSRVLGSRLWVSHEFESFFTPLNCRKLFSVYVWCHKPCAVVIVWWFSIILRLR